MSNEGRIGQRLSTLANNWRALALRGLVALLFGLPVLFWPGLSAGGLVHVIAVWAVVTGVLGMIAAILLHAEVLLKAECGGLRACPTDRFRIR